MNEIINDLLKNLALTLVLALLGGAAWAADYKIDISLETGPNHVRNIAVLKYAEELQQRSNGRLEVKVFHGASKYKGTNVPTALGQGALDMGMPGTWHLGKFVPEFNMPGLPMFYGVGREDQYKIWDGEIGQELNKRVEEKLGVKVIGRWFDLGFGQMFFVDQAVASHGDLSGLKMRAPGGAANLARYETFDAKAIKIAWPDVPQALQRGTVDGLLTTHESVRSAKLWDAGVKHAYNDDQAFFQYIPMVSAKAWGKLPAELQQLMVDVWEETVDGNRAYAAERQASARADGEKQGISNADASADDLAAMREKLMATQKTLVSDLKMDQALIEKTQAALDAVLK